MSGIGQKRAAEGRIDRDGKEEDNKTAETTTTTTAAPEVTLVRRGPRPEDAPSNNPFKGLATTAAPATATGTAAAAPTGFAGFGAAASTTGFGGFGAFGATAKPTAAETAGAAAAAKFTFSFGAPAAAAAAPAAATTTTAAAPTFSFNFGSAAAKPAEAAAPAPAAAPAAPVTGGFNFGAKFDFGAGVKAFAAAQTAEKKEEEEVDPETEAPVVVKVNSNALSMAAVKTDLAAGDESDTILLDVPNTKVYLLGFKDVVGEDGKTTPSATEKEWKEKGVGTLKVSSFESNGATHHRVLMHSSQTKQVVLNVTIDTWFAVTGTTDKTVAFRTVAMEDGKPKPHMYNLRVAETAVQSLADKLKEITPKKKE